MNTNEGLESSKDNNESANHDERANNDKSENGYRRVSKISDSRKNLIIKSLGLGRIHNAAETEKRNQELKHRVYADLKKTGVFDSLRVLANAGDQFNDDPVYDSLLKSIENIESLFSEDTLPLFQDYEKAKDLANRLAADYGVSVAVLDTDENYHSEQNIKKSVQEETYFVSAESPEESAKITEHLVKFQQLKFRLMIDAATAKRVEQSTATSQALSKTIDGIKEELVLSKKKPTLSRIAEILTERGIASPRGKQSKWHAETVKRIIDRAYSDSRDHKGQER